MEYLWINQEYIKRFTPINANVDAAEVAPHIETAQLIHVREILGKNLYVDLTNKIKAATLSEKEAELVDIIKQALAYRAAEISIPFLSIKIRNKGAVKMADQFAQPASIEEMKYLRSELSQRASYFEDRAKDYLCQFSSDFPLYTQYNDNEILPNFNNPFNDEIYLDREEYWDRKRGLYYYGPNRSFPNRKY